MDSEEDEDYTTQQLLLKLALDDDDDFPTSKSPTASEHSDTPLTTAQSSTPSATSCTSQPIMDPSSDIVACTVPSIMSVSSSQSSTPCPTPSITTQASEHQLEDSTSFPNEKTSLERKEPYHPYSEKGSLEGHRLYLKSLVRDYQSPKNLCLNGGLKPGSLSPSLLQGLAALKRDDFRLLLEREGRFRPFQTTTMEIDEVAHQAAGSLEYQQDSNIYTWINYHYQALKWNTLPGVVPPTLIDQLFDEQTAAWNTVTKGFATKVEELLMNSIRKCLSEVCRNRHVVEAIRSSLLRHITDKIEDFRDFCSELRQNELEGLHDLAEEETFIMEMQKARAVRLVQTLARMETRADVSVTPDSECSKSTKAAQELVPSTTDTSILNSESLQRWEDAVANPKTTKRAEPFGSGISGPSSFAALSKNASGRSIFSAQATVKKPTPCIPISTGSSFTPAVAATTTPTKSMTQTLQQPPHLVGHTFSLIERPTPKFGEPTVPVSPFAKLSLRRKSVPEKPNLPVATMVKEQLSEAPKPVQTSSLASLAKRNLSGLQEALSDDRRIVYEIHDILKAYYSISVQHYADAVCKTALNKKFIREVMDVFCDDWIDGLSDIEVWKIVADTDREKVSRNKREFLET